DITAGISGLADVGSPNVNPGPGQVLPPARPDPGIATSPNPATVTPLQPAVAPPVTPNTPHAGLMSMIQGMMLGVDALGRSIATQGREGGVQEVLQAQKQKQEMKLAQDANARAQAESTANITHLQALTNSTIAQTELLKMNAPLEHQKLVIDNQKSLYDL